MASYRMSMKAWKKSETVRRPDIPVIAVPKDERGVCASWTWEQLLCHGTLYHVVDGSHAPKGIVWFRQGIGQDGSLEGRVLLYSEGA